MKKLVLMTLISLSGLSAHAVDDYLCAPANNNPGVCNQLSYCYYQPGSCLSRNGQQDYLCAPANNNPEVCNQLSYCYAIPGQCRAR